MKLKTEFDHNSSAEDRRLDWRPKEKQVCKKCGTPGLHWVEYAIGQFALYNGPRRHACVMADLGDFDG